jgi:hypothetical protein
MVQRLHPHPFLSIFNGPDTSASTAIRDRSTVPLQALFMANSELVDEQARGLANSLLAAETDPRERIQLAYQRVFLRPARKRELRRGGEFIDAYSDLLADEGLPVGQRPLLAWVSFARTLLTANEFLFVD